MQEEAFGLAHALDRANYLSSKANKTAALWTIAAALFATFVAIAAWLS
jgi:hypothetical protein